MSNFEIKLSTDVDIELIRSSKTTLPQLMLAARQGLALVGKVDSKEVGVCIAENRGGTFEILYIFILPDYRQKGYGRELLLHTLDYVRFLGGEAAEVGAGNADIQMFTFYQRIGFRVAGVDPDYYTFGNERPEVENSIVNRDQIRYRADLEAMAARKEPI